jgi:hypothetical protein
MFVYRGIAGIRAFDVLKTGVRLGVREAATRRETLPNPYFSPKG